MIIFFRKQFRGIAVFTLFVFICFTLTLDYSFSQEENLLLKAQGLYKQGNFIEAVKVLEAFIKKIKGSPNEKKRLAESNLLLARIYYDAGEDARVAEYMKTAVEAYADIGKEEGNLDFKSQLEQVRAEWLKAQSKNKETTLEVPTEKIEAAKSQPPVQEKEKPAPQLKKKKKFPWLLAILGVGVIVVLVVLLTKKKKQTLTVTVGEGVTGNPDTGSHIYKKDEIVHYYYVPSSSYDGLVVLLDGNQVPANGNITMNSNHTLSVNTLKPTYVNGVLMVKGVRYELVLIPAGTFQMGSNFSETYSNEQPVHIVRISRAFWLSKTEVTQGLWKALMNNNPSFFTYGDDYPVGGVSWDDCQSFIQKLNQILGGNAFRLPTEAEWEYACRAGTTGERYGDLDAIAWYGGNAGASTHPVGQKQPNSWGLYDTLGNVWEWCQDWYGNYSDGYQTDPTGPSSGSIRIDRGGSFQIKDARGVRSAYRSGNLPDLHGNSDLGFRLARTNE